MYGVHGKADNRYKVFIPTSETYIGSNKFSYRRGGEYKVQIIDVDKSGTSLIGTFKPYITHPLQEFKNIFQEGQVLSHLQYIRASEHGVYFRIKYGRNKSVEALLLAKDVSNWCFIKNLDMIFHQQYTCPMVLKEINMDTNLVLLSIKDLTNKNKNRIDSTDYGNVYSGVVLGREHNIYSVLLDNIWIEVKVDSDAALSIGERVNVLKASSISFVTISNVSS